MDLKGINWVGQMYQKCETMLLEVEDDMYQDVVNYVENQVQTVGDSVKKFYSDVIEDLLPPPSAEELTSGDSDMPAETYADTCAYKKTNEGAMEVHVNVDADRVMKTHKAINVEVENHASFYHGISSVNSSSGSSLADSLHGSCSELCSTLYEDGVVHNCSSYGANVNTDRKNLPPFVMAGATTSVKEGSLRASEIFPCLHGRHEASCDKIAISVSGLDGIEDVSKCGYDVSVDGPSSDKSMLLRSIDNKVTEVSLSSRGSLPAESNDITSSHGMVPMVRSAENWDAGCSDSTDKQTISANSGKEDESEKDEIDSENVIELDPEDIHQGDHLNLEESCIVVDGDELHRVPLSKVKGKSRAYKNKIRDALTLRRKSARKEEYKQLAVLYAEDAGSNHRSAESIKPGLTMDSKRSSQTHDVGESEWEFL